MNRLNRVAWHASLALIISSALSIPADAQTIGTAMVTYLNGQLNSRVGSGESAAMATEALRVGGGEFYTGDLGADAPGDGDKVWGTLVTVIQSTDGNWSDSNPDNSCLPGDVIQFGGSARFGNVAYPASFTAVVRTVNGDNYRPTVVYQQNFNNVRTVQSVSFNVQQLSAGWIRIYRPVTRNDVHGTWKFTVVNNSSRSQTYTVMFGVNIVSTVTAAAADTAGSFFVHKVTTDGTVPCVVNNDNTIYVETAKGNEIYNSADGSFGIRQINP